MFIFEDHSIPLYRLSLIHICKCVPCREGTRRMLEILERIVAGEGTLEDLDMLEDLARMISDTALCGLGKTAASPVASTLKYFRDE